MALLDRLRSIEESYEELTGRLGDPEIIRDQKLFADTMRQHAQLKPLVEKIKELNTAIESIEDAKAMKSDATDAETSNYLDEEIQQNIILRDSLQQEINELMVTSDPNDSKNVIMEIRAGTGGDEAALFAGDLLRMYTKYAEGQGWKVQIMDIAESEAGGYKEVVIEINGAGAYSKLKFESGIHRVQRVPATESQGRIHTSAATVAVLPEVEELEFELNPNDVRIDIFRSGGPGGQSVNTTDSAIRLTHLPTGLTVSCQDERSQLQNKERAFTILRARLYDQEIARVQQEQATIRKLQVGTGDRSGRIRTYNFPQGRLTDHRIGLTLYKLDAIMMGDLQPVVDALTAADRAEKLEGAVAGDAE